MKYAKLIESEIMFAPRKMQTEIDGEPYIVYNPTAAMLEADGWLPVIFTDMPDDAPDGYHYEATYTEWQTETGREILQEWMLVEDPDGISDSEALEIILGGGANDES